MSPDRLSATFAALADPTRRAILARLASGETTVSELARPFEMSLPAVTKHLKVLQRAGLISQGRQAQWRPCKLEAEPLQDVSNWVEQYRQFWEQRLDRLEEYLRELQASEKLANEKQANDRAADAADEQMGKAPAAVSKAKGKKEGKKK